MRSPSQMLRMANFFESEIWFAYALRRTVRSFRFSVAPSDVFSRAQYLKPVPDRGETGHHWLIKVELA